MLQTIREHTQGWIAGTIISIIIVTFALWGIHSYFVGGAGNNIIAEVNGVEITKEQLSMAYERLRKQFQMQYGANNTSQINDNKLKERALKGLIDVEALRQASYYQGFRISDQQIDNYIQSIPDFQVQGQFSFERFRDILTTAGLSTSEFLDLLRTNLLIDQPKLGILFSSFSLPNETNYAISLVNQERELAYLILPTAFLAEKVEVTTQQIKAYYDSHRQEFMTPEQMTIDYVELSMPAVAETIEPSEDALKNFYQENTVAFSEPKQWKIVDITIPLKPNASADEQNAALKIAKAERNAIANGADFAETAKNYMSSWNGATWLALNQLPAELKKPISELVKIGDISQPIKTEKGFSIIKIVDVREPQTLSYEAAKDNVKLAYVKQQAEEQFAQKRDKLADLAYEHPDSLVYASEALNLPIKTSEKFSLETSGAGILQSRKVRAAAFSNDVMNLQNNSDVISVSPETVVVIHAKSHTAQVQQPLADVEKQIIEIIRAKDADTNALTMAKQLINDLKAGKDISPQLMTLKGDGNVNALSINWVKTGFLGRYANQVDSAILDTAFRLPDPAKTVNKKPTYGLAKVQNGYAIIALEGVKTGSADSKQAKIFAEQAQTSDGLLEYELYKEIELSKAKVKTTF